MTVDSVTCHKLQSQFATVENFVAVDGLKSMVWVLSQENVGAYLRKQALISPTNQSLPQITCCSSKNFNLVVAYPDGPSFLVKQKRLDAAGNFRRDFYDEWRVCSLMQSFEALNPLLDMTSEVLVYDSGNAIIVLEFFPEYIDLSDYYSEIHQYPAKIGAELGQSLARIHALTYQTIEYCDYLIEDSNRVLTRVPSFLNRFTCLRPGIFGEYCLDGVKFFKTLQSCPELLEAIADLHEKWQPSCLIHRDLKLDNVLVHQNLQTDAQASALKIIDWELFTWGDPLYDLATVLGSYLIRWLNSVGENRYVPIQQALSLAKTPLELIQPSLRTLMTSYCQNFPALLQERDEFWAELMQFTGFYLLQRLLHQMRRHYPFDNAARCSLQVVKRLICAPDLAAKSILGLSPSDLNVPLAA